MRVTVYNYDEEMEDDGAFDLNVKDPITDDQVREHVDCFTNNWTSIHFQDENKRVVLPKD